MKEKTIYALGVFDGVHLGHCALLRACCALSEKLNCKAGVVTFTSHPDALIRGKTPPLINTLSDRRKLLTGLFPLDTVVCLPFDRHVMETSWQDFFRLLLDQYNAAGIVCGHDFRFGFRGEGNALLLQKACRESNIPCVIIPEQHLNGTAISSTHIRKLLEDGQTEQAVRFLGHPHILSGKVVSGQQLGRKLGFPTANLVLPEEVVPLRKGVYVCRACADGRIFPAITNIGTRPTVDGHHITIESWLIGFDGDLYEKELTLHFYAYMREEQKFTSLDSLQQQIRKDAQQALNFLEKH